MTKKGQKFGLKMRNVLGFGLYLKKVHREKISGRKLQGFWANIQKKVVGNLAYREMLFYKKALVETLWQSSL